MTNTVGHESRLRRGLMAGRLGEFLRSCRAALFCKMDTENPVRLPNHLNSTPGRQGEALHVLESRHVVDKDRDLIAGSQGFLRENDRLGTGKTFRVYQFGHGFLLYGVRRTGVRPPRDPD